MPMRSRPGVLAVAILFAGILRAAAADGFVARDAAGTSILLLGHSLGTTGGIPNKLPLTGLADAAGNDIGATNPLRVAPSIAAVTPIDHGGAVTGSVQAVMGANAARKGGWLTADPANTGTIYVSVTGAASTTPGAGKQCVLLAGATCPLTVNGYVIQNAVSIAGTAGGDAFEAVEFQ